MSLAPSPMHAVAVAAAGAVALGRDGVEVAAEQHPRALRAGQQRRCRRGRAPRAAAPRTWAASAASSRDSEGMSISSSVRAASRSPRSGSLGAMSGHHTRMRFCGIDVSARPDNQQLCTLHERKGTDGIELVATFYAPGTVEHVARTIQGFGRGEAVVGIDAPSGRRLGPARPRRARARRGSACPTAATSACGCATPCSSAAGCRSTRSRRAAARRVPEWMTVGFELFDALAPLGRWIPDGANGALEGAVGDSAMRSGRVFETYPDAIFCALLGHRPPPKRTPWGRPAADRGAQAQGRLRRRRRALAPHARRDRRLRRRLRRLRAERRARHLGRRSRRRA